MDFTSADIPELADNTERKETTTNSSANEKTEEVIHKLEEDIDSAYSSLEARFSSLWKNASSGAQSLQDKMGLEERKKKFMDQLKSAKENINNNESVQHNISSLENQLKDLGEHVKGFESKIDFKTISDQANKALDSLDSKLEGIEQQAGQIVSSFASFFSSMVSIDKPAKPEIKEPETIFSTSAVSSAAYGSTRYETDLFKLHTTESRYLEAFENEEEELKSFDAESKTTDISSLLKKYPDTLEKLMNSLVPVKIPYNVFWYRYFRLENELKENELKRKELLSKKDLSKDKSSANEEDGEEDEDEEDFTWDDDEDEEEEEDDAAVPVEKP
ncbi:hypothetical protein CLUG_05674 [Clavispora lusitaniae ATCC 42720]|uniref:BSD domain-containing protein n=2 Tax=Clavispora lusitaniae TaxID=36911 RepID=C4YBU6_CLAL4|nr:uncharacterized protein CLUG_05674 [Clavispora lusitaniae ATCC 42720]EEQ41546.1 hypothetical protein CLUG_05674 [Clavispora lusitaniae ATCC 42720]OVF09468.1 hypothetical protein A9F13_05g02827 [Clavispora lusitaniae]